MADEEKKVEETKTPATDVEKKEETLNETPKDETPAKEEKKEVPAEVPAKEEAPAKAPEKEAPVLEKKAEVKVPKEFKALIETIEKLSVLELHQLVKVMEERFDVSAAAVAVAAPGGGGGEAAEEKDSFTVELKDIGAQKIAVIKAVKNLLGLGLKEAKDLVDGAPSVMKEDVKKEEAEEMKTAIEEAGGTVELK